MSASLAPRPTTRRELRVTWLLWAGLLLALLVTYSWRDPADLYHVSRDGLLGGLSRTLVAVDFPVALAAVALTLVAMASLPNRAWWLAVPTIVLCAVATVPGVVDDGDLDARWVNVVPAIGVGLALGLGVAAGRTAVAGCSPPLPLDGVRRFVGVVAVVASIPWIFADLGVYAPEWIFIMERPIVGSNGEISPAVHLGHHHGFDGALFVVTAALLSRVAIHRHRLWVATSGYLALLFAYGVVNFGQDAWNEQLWKRGLVDASIPNAYHPALEPAWLVILVLAIATWLALRHEHRRTVGALPGPSVSDERVTEPASSELGGAGDAGRDAPLGQGLHR